jgi:hypothetical protein
MSNVASGGFGSYGIPGQTDIYQSVEATVQWGGFFGPFTWQYAVINSSAVDAGNTPTTFLRPGLLMGQKTSDQTWLAYVYSNTDGTGIASGILTIDMDMIDPYTNAAAPRNVPVLTSGPVKSSQIIGLDNNARSQLRGRFLFDDDLPNIRSYYPISTTKVFATGTAYQVLVADCGSMLIANSSGTFTFTLPAIADGLTFTFMNYVAQNMVVTSTEGSNVIADTNITASTITFSTASHKQGAIVDFWSFYDGTTLKWAWSSLSASTVVATVS